MLNFYCSSHEKINNKQIKSLWKSSENYILYVRNAIKYLPYFLQSESV